MSLALYVLDVPEFQPVVHTAEAAGMSVEHRGDYLRLSSADAEIVLTRDPDTIRTALWHAALTGGLDGRIVAFTSDTLHLAEEQA